MTTILKRYTHSFVLTLYLSPSWDSASLLYQLFIILRAHTNNFVHTFFFKQEYNQWLRHLTRKTDYLRSKNVTKASTCTVGLETVSWSTNLGELI